LTGNNHYLPDFIKTGNVAAESSYSIERIRIER